MIALADEQKTVSDAELVADRSPTSAQTPAAPATSGIGHRHGPGHEEVGYGHGV